MRSTIQHYLSLNGARIGELADIVGRSRETIRKYKKFTTAVGYDPETLAVYSFDVWEDRKIFHWEKE